MRGQLKRKKNETIKRMRENKICKYQFYLVLILGNIWEAQTQCYAKMYNNFRHVFMMTQYCPPKFYMVYFPISSSSSKKKSSDIRDVTRGTRSTDFGPLNLGSAAISNSVSPSSRWFNRSWRFLNSRKERYKYAATPIVMKQENTTTIVPTQEVWWCTNKCPRYTGMPNSL